MVSRRDLLSRNDQIMSNNGDQHTGSINLTLRIDSDWNHQPGDALTSPLLNYEVVPDHGHVLKKHAEEPEKSSDNTCTGQNLDTNFKSELS